MVAHTVKTTRAAEAQRVPVRQLVDRRAAAFAALREPLALLVDACRTLAGELAPFLPAAAATGAYRTPRRCFPASSLQQSLQRPILKPIGSGSIQIVDQGNGPPERKCESGNEKPVASQHKPAHIPSSGLEAVRNSGGRERGLRGGAPCRSRGSALGVVDLSYVAL